VPADIHGILMRVASLRDTLSGKIKAWSDPEPRQSKRLKDLADIARYPEAASPASHMEAEKGFRRIRGHRHLPQLIAALNQPTLDTAAQAA
jgi:hypothetical protein